MPQPPDYRRRRAAMVALGALMLVWAGRDMQKVPAGAWPRLIGTALLLNTVNYALLLWGTAHAPTGLASIVNFATIPIFTLLASRAIEKERIEARKLAAIGLGTVGLGFLFATRALGGLSVVQGDPQEAIDLLHVVD